MKDVSILERIFYSLNNKNKFKLNNYKFFSIYIDLQLYWYQGQDIRKLV